MAVLEQLSEDALAGRSRAVLIEGSAGMGKSALASTFVESLSADGWRALKYSFHGASSKGPMAELVRLAQDLGAGPSPTDWTFFDEIFFLSKDGLLIHHCGSGSSVDEDILGSMLSAVQDFVRDSFGDSDKAGGLNELSYKGLKIIIEHGEFTFIAAVVSRGEHRSMRDEVVSTLRSLEIEQRDTLEIWNGDLSTLGGVQERLEALNSMRFPRPRVEGAAAAAQQNLRFEWVRNSVIQGAAEKPLVISFDDVNHADKTSIGSLAYLLRGLTNKPVLFILSSRSDTDDASPGGIFSKLDIEGRIARLPLGPLDGASAHELIKAILRDGEVSKSLIDGILSASGGVPGHIIELVKVLRREGRIVSEANLWILKGHRAPEAGLVRDSLYRILEGLEACELSLLEYAAVLDDKIDEKLLAKGIDCDDDELRRDLDFSVQHGFLERTSEGGYRFGREGLGDALRSGMGPVRLAAWHRVAARALLDMSYIESEELTFALARHFAEGHECEQGIYWCLKAGELTESRYAFPEAVKFFEWAVELMEMSGTHPEYAATLRRLGEDLEIDGDFNGGIETYEKLLHVQGIDDDTCGETLRCVGQIYFKLGNIPKAKEVLNNALNLFSSSDRSLVKARAMNSLGSLVSKENPKEALLLHSEYLDIAEKSSSTKDIAEAHRWLGGAYFYAKEVRQALEQWQRALQAYETLGDDFGRSTVLYNMGAAHNIMGDYSTSLLSLEEAVRLKERLGDLKGLASALNNLGIAHARTGGFEKAIAAHNRSIEIKVRIGDLVGVANSYNSIGALYWQEDKYLEAADHFERELDIMRKVGDDWGTAQAHNNIASVLCNVGQVSKATQHLSKSLEIAKRMGFRDISAYALTTKARIASKYGDWSKANEEFASAAKAAVALNEPRHLGMTYMGWGEEGLNHGDKDALDHLKKAIEYFEKAGTAPLANKAKALLVKATG
ncbi:MAG: tetratricopeptide repeat protein [Euryarchaeota archaeon]|nr:tetratricopeptide repeat protein [Euryarchaeota archaeon]